MKRPSKPTSTFGRQFEAYAVELEQYASYLEGKVEAYRESRPAMPSREDMAKARKTASGFEDMLNSFFTGGAK